ncbi:MAG: FAD-dependent oxidoreductase, partial [Chloroflexota bacterium]|nr:FAD-dependent oxidoreductase [Chloroflexota bacterium]
RIYEEGFQEALGDRLRLQAEVREIRQEQDGVRIVYRDRAQDRDREVTGDYCVCAIPLSVLQNIRADFSSEMAQAIREIPYFPSGKIGLQMRRRFWEEEDWIYGGMSFLNIPEIDTIAYPDYNYQDEKGVIQAYYNFGLTAIEVSRLSHEERVELALEHGSKLHPQYRDMFETGFSVAWHRAPYLLGAWPDYSERTREQYYPRLLEPDGRIYLTGEHLSYVTAWQEGAILASWMQIEKLHERVMQSQ